MTVENMKDRSRWIINECDWTEEFGWFLVDEGEIKYSFKSRASADAFRKEFFLSYTLLTSIDEIHNIMIYPHNCRSWADKRERCVVERS